MKLLVDIGNTRLKWALADASVLTVAEPLVHQTATFKQNLLQRWWMLPQPPVQLAISCVSHAGLLQQVILLTRELWPTVEIVIPKAQAHALGVTNAYLEPEKLGIDRWLALLAVRQLCQQAACVVDCGTAITVDFVNSQGQHLGGVISPGLTLMKQALANGTEQLPYTEQAYKTALATHTAAAIHSGILYAAVGLIEKSLQRQQAGFKVFLTGGDAAVIAAELAVEATIYDDLVLRGLLAVVNAGVK
ncbi:MAG: type III pantothenate kinase [Methylococcaceae bacterium]|nr:type III pantothenate kinase [Methylococcaceae bacterium]